MPGNHLDETSFPAWREAIERAETNRVEHVPRSYPGYPRWPLPRAKRRYRSSLARALGARRSQRVLATELPSAAALGRIMQLAHGVGGERGRGPVPSAGGLQALELYLATWRDNAWLPHGLYHYDRAGHFLSAIATIDVRASIPSLLTVEGGAFAWVIAGDRARVAAKYGGRAIKFLLLEAGHLMQNLCLAATELGLVTVPLGGFYERSLAQAFQLPAGDEVLYVAVCG